MLAFNTCGLPFFYWVKIQVCKIKAELEENDRSPGPLTVFAADAKGVKLIDDRELLVAGKMYDIVKTQTRNGVKFYYAASDHDEDVYINKLADAEKSAAQETSQPAKALKLYEAKYFPRGDRHDFGCLSTIIRVDKVVLNDPSFYPLDFKDIFSPPPESSLT